MLKDRGWLQQPAAAGVGGWGGGGFPGQTHTCTHSGVRISPLVQGALFGVGF